MPQTAALIATYLEPELVARIAAEPGVEVLYEPELLPVPRYRCDHTGTARDLTPDQQARWARLLERADVAFDFDWQAPAEFPQRAPNLRWVQGTSAGIGGFVNRTGLDRTDLTFTTAAGIHAVPLAEFAVTGALYFVKGVPELRRRQAAHRWERYTTTQLAGRTVTVVGLGGMGREVARAFAALGTKVLGLGRDRIGELDEVLPGTDVLVLCCPLTPQTEGLIGAEQLALLPDGAIIVNISRGQVLDEPALLQALTSGRVSAALDVFGTEPLPAGSPLWDLDNVLVSPHSASTVATENAALTDLFCDNLRRYRAGEPLRNLYHRDRGY
ncbi:D-2-hydroxyacid dehydrogenase [Dactylosporangium matsuzakiense]|uniref:2-hydroxyacid dehydrogenase n=1 Tax=Dactylosporangium matsuzakiense TaxID=53360 RepID=A0A9W6KIM9_9ACTN|nr:D-2-hydroxyacid dehydrogenase [Dactylosporangium matsuzakiense]GLL02213.1 2-hydroxyacid dehydrogenase [Dactylosporangium matsuzakiense]